jgi:transcriptional regulator with XRE-family HTH domain
MGLHEMGDIMRKAREALHETQDDLSFRSGVSQGWISQVELGHVANPSTEKVRKIAAALGMDARTLFAAQFGIPFGDQDAGGVPRAESATPPLDDPVQIIEQIAALTDRLDRVMRADRESRARRQNAAS